MVRLGIEIIQEPLLLEMAAPLLTGAGGLPEKLPPLDVPAMVERITSYGFRLLELNTDLNIFFPHSFGVPTLKRLMDFKESLGLSYTVHLPLWSLEPSSPFEEVRKAAVDVMVDAILRFAPLEPEVYVFHATGPLATEFFTSPSIPDLARPLLMLLFQRNAARSIEEILERTNLPPRALAVETIQFPLDLTLGLAEEFDLSVCFDTGHVFARMPGPVDFHEALAKCLPRLKEVHLHDAWFRLEPDGTARWADHLPLGEGEVPLEDFFSSLKKVNFEGPIIFELTIPEAIKSLERLREVMGQLPI
ncbi:MAG: cobamide remodeling phosphodiesterase CbiR [Anaerolineae bacterium]|nr:sugar phosphate isomerase/epimerase [Anaerolineae bacterium]MDW8101761.1 cobamide remodeling phosphodiesterase CbiR [Anaerolineae bacterium]